MKRRRILAPLLISALVLSQLSGCATGSTPDTQQETPDSAAGVQQSQFEIIEEYTPDSEKAIILSGDTVHSLPEGCSADGSVITVTAGGTYSISGSLNGQIIVDAGGEDVRLVLSGADITCSDSAPIYIRDGHLVTITLAEGSQNTITDGSQYVYDDAEKEEPDAALFSKADLVLEGTGSLTVNANFNNGIQSKDTLEIHSGTYTVNAANHGITGKDSLEIRAGSFTVNAGGDGLRSNNADSLDVGWISIVDGSFVINAGQDGLQAESSLHIGGGEYDIITGGGSVNSSSENDDWGSWEQGNNMPPGGFGGFGDFGGFGGQPESSDRNTDNGTSAKGIKAGSDMLAEGGIIRIDSSDDSIHSNGSISITGGDFSVSSGDDGIHADSSLEISAGTLRITKSYEGVEGVKVLISGGELDITASDDGINSAGGSDGGQDRPGANMFSADKNCDVTITGGTVTIDAGGDGIDSNGNFYVRGGALAVNGPTNQGNGAFDYAGECIISGGIIAAAGSSGMAQGASSSSSQASMLLCFNGTIKAGTLISLVDDNGEAVFSFAPSKDYSSIFASSPGMVVGSTYRLLLGGSCTGQHTNGIYTNGALDDATEITEVTIDRVNTNYGGGGGFGGPGGQGGHGGHGGPGGHGGFGGPGGPGR